MTYGQVAKVAGNPRAARAVSWILHSGSRKYNLPWHRVINSKGKISIKSEYGYNRQKKLLKEEGIEFDENDKIDLEKYQVKKSRNDFSTHTQTDTDTKSILEDS
jgi:methylated-DNA-protein-cysteine methyltransferase-like protein